MNSYRRGRPGSAKTWAGIARSKASTAGRARATTACTGRVLGGIEKTAEARNPADLPGIPDRRPYSYLLNRFN